MILKLNHFQNTNQIVKEICIDRNLLWILLILWVMSYLITEWKYEYNFIAWLKFLECDRHCKEI